MRLTDQAEAVVAAATLSKSEKIRRLKQQGMKQADIARALGIRDQFVSNVVRNAASPGTLHAPAGRRPAAAEKTLQVRTQLGEGGRLVIPAPMRTALGLEIGDDVLLRLEDDGLRVLTPRQALRRAQDLVRQYVPAGTSLVDELIAERRLEAARE